MTPDVPGTPPQVPATNPPGEEPGTGERPSQEPAPRPPTRWTHRFSLRARLIALVVAVAAAALVAVDVVIPLVTRSSLISSKDQTLVRVVGSLRLPTSQQFLENLSQSNPLAGEIGWSVVDASGMAKVLVAPPGHSSANPAVGDAPPVDEPTTVPDADAGGSYRILARGDLQDQFQQPITLVAWIPMDDVASTIGELVFLEVVISLGLLVLVGLTAGLVIRRELKPLEVMAQTADEIAAGHLDRRVDPGAPGTEVGRLGTAFNDMLDGIQGLLAERDADEERLRRFIADASHELRTPVSAIRGYTDLYRAGALPEEVAVDRAMDRMGFESRRMGALVDDLLTLTQADSAAAQRRDRIDVAELLTGVVDDAAVIDRSRVWRLAGAGAPIVVLGDRLRLHQVFANLLGNVRTHTPAGTTATVSLHPAGNQVAVVISDDGPGVADEDLPKLFDRFFRVDPARSRERGGSGLGLSIVAAIVRAHGGLIRASQTPGGGLTMTVLLPQAPGQPVERAEVAEPQAPSDGSGSVPPRRNRADLPEPGGTGRTSPNPVGRQQSGADSPFALHRPSALRR